MDLWVGNRKRIIVLNREDMICTSDRNAWADHFAKQGIRVVFSNGQLGMVLTLSTLFNFYPVLNAVDDDLSLDTSRAA